MIAFQKNKICSPPPLYKLLAGRFKLAFLINNPLIPPYIYVVNCAFQHVKVLVKKNNPNKLCEITVISKIFNFIVGFVSGVNN